MVAINTIDAIKYGFRLLGYLLAVSFLGGLLVFIGFGFTGPYGRGNPVLTLVFTIAGVSVMYAGALGLLYKVIGDGVAAGNKAVRGPNMQGGQPPRGQPRAEQPQDTQG